jgi:hypothetical protein
VFELFEQKFGRKYDIATPGDYDGDGVADLAYYREKKGEWRVSRQFKLKKFGRDRDIPVPGDYNGDGRTDPALFRPETAEWFIYDMDRDKVIKVQFGKWGDVPVPGNWDGDEAGMTDLAVFHVETQEWHIAIWDEKKEAWVEKKKIRIDGERKKLRVTHGEIGDIPVQADYDGDGTTDHAYYRRNNGLWDVKDGIEIELGTREDVPVPNDWAGLGRVIPTIFRERTGRWLSVDNLLSARHGKGGQALMSGR